MKNGMKKIGAAMLAMLLPATTTVYADYLAAYDNNQKALEVSGSCAPGKAVVVSIYKDTTAAPILADAVKAGTDGNYRLTILLPEDLDGGKYYLKVGGEDKVSDFMYIDESKITDRLEELNAAAAKGAEAFGSYLAENAAALSIDSILLEQYQEPITEIFCLNLPKTGLTDANDFINQYYQAVALAQISEGEDFSTTIQQYESYIQFDAKKIYSAMNAEEQALFAARLKGDALLEQEAEKVFQCEAVMAQVDASATWEALRNTILGVDASGTKVKENFSIISPDTTKYDKLTDKNAFYKKLFAVKSSLTTIDVLAAQFESLAAEVLSDQDDDVTTGTTGGGVSGGGISGGGSGGGAAGAGSSWYDVSGDESIKLEEEDFVQRETAVTLSDIDGHWAQADIQALCDANILKGYEDGSFQPERTISRGEFAVILSRAFSLQNRGGQAAVFTDVNTGDWYAEAVYEVQRAGVIQGYDGKFEPEEGITRQDLCVMIYRALNLTDEVVPQFADADNIADYARNAVGSLAQMGIINGTEEGKFAPNDTATRAEIATIINRCRSQEVKNEN